MILRYLRPTQPKNNPNQQRKSAKTTFKPQLKTQHTIFHRLYPQHPPLHKINSTFTSNLVSSHHFIAQNKALCLELEFSEHTTYLSQSGLCSIKHRFLSCKFTPSGLKNIMERKQPLSPKVLLGWARICLIIACTTPSYYPSFFLVIEHNFLIKNYLL